VGKDGAQQWIALLRETWSDYQRHSAQWLAAALAYFAAFAVAPLIIVLVEVAGFFLHNHQHVLGVIFGYLRRDLGSGSQAVEAIVVATFNQPRQSTLSQVIGWAIFVLAAIGLFNALQFALNTAWGVDEKRGLLAIVRQRVVGFAMMLVVALLLLGSVFANAALTTAAAYFNECFVGLAAIVNAGDLIVTFALVWILFALLFLYLPNCRIGWRDVWLGAGLTAVLFSIGQFLLGWYLGRAGLASTYGAVGSLVAFLLWANYTAQIFLFGAEFTHVYATRHGTLAQAHVERSR
jgi:membrane protein